MVRRRLVNKNLKNYARCDKMVLNAAARLRQPTYLV